MNSGTSNARVEQLHARISELDSKIASQAATIAQQKQIGILTTELKDQPAEIQKVSARVEMNKSTKKWFSIIIRAGVDTGCSRGRRPGYSCNIKLGTKIETPRRSEPATTMPNTWLIWNRDRRSRLQPFRDSRGARGGRALLFAGSLDDFDEAAWVQACATDKSAVDVGLAH